MSEAPATLNAGDAAPTGTSSPLLTALAAAFQHVTIGMSVRAPDGQLIDVNPAYSHMLGYEREELLALGFEFANHPDEAIDFTRWQRLAAGEMDSYQRQKRYLRKDGSLLWGLLTVSALRDERGDFAGAFAHVQDVTAQKLAEAALREQEAQLEALVSQLPVALYSLEPGATGTFQYVSPRFTHLSGLMREDLPTSFHALLERVHPDDREAVQEVDEHATRTGESVQLEYRIRGGNGEWIWVDNRAVLMRDERGDPLVWHGTLLIVIEQKRLEASLRDSQERFRRAFEDAAIGMSLGTPDDICLDANPAYCRIVGRPREALLGRSFAELTHPDDVGAYVRQHARLYANEVGAYQMEKRYPRPDGTVVTGLLTVSAVRDDTGAHLYDIGQLQDITAQKVAEAALRESEARFRSIFEGAGIGMALSVPEGTILVANPALEQLLGYAPGELEGVRIEDITYPDDLALQADHLRRMRQNELDAYQFEKRFVRKDGGIVWGLLGATAVKDDHGAIQAVIGQVQDITARKNAELATEDALLAQQEAIDELEQLNLSKSRFLSTISHEFRTPLTAIIGYSELLAGNVSDLAVAEDAAVIHREASRLSRMVDDVLLVDRENARHMSLKMESVDCNSLIMDVVETFRPLTDSHQFVLDLDPKLHAVQANRDRLSQALTNLVSNAVKYSPAGGTVTIVTRNDGGDVVLSVRDVGIGVAAEDLSRIFAPFERVETGIAGRIAGTGLGLAIVQEITSLHKGQIWAESELGLGSTFHLVMPAARGRKSEVGSRA